MRENGPSLAAVYGEITSTEQILVYDDFEDLFKWTEKYPTPGHGISKSNRAVYSKNWALQFASKNSMLNGVQWHESYRYIGIRKGGIFEASIICMLGPPKRAPLPAYFNAWGYGLTVQFVNNNRSCEFGVLVDFDLVGYFLMNGKGGFYWAGDDMIMPNAGDWNRILIRADIGNMKYLSGSVGSIDLGVKDLELGNMNWPESNFCKIKAWLGVKSLSYECATYDEAALIAV